nr:hypothetical protein [uncultured Arsenicibacter sp.]
MNRTLITRSKRMHEAQLIILRLFERDMTATELAQLKDTLSGMLEQQPESTLGPLIHPKSSLQEVANFGHGL